MKTHTQKRFYRNAKNASAYFPLTTLPCTVKPNREKLSSSHLPFGALLRNTRWFRCIPSVFLAHYCPTYSRTCSKAGLLKINSSWYTRLLATHTGNDITLIKRSIFSPRRTVATQSRFLRNAARDWAASFINKFADPLHDSAAGKTAD